MAKHALTLAPDLAEAHVALGRFPLLRLSRIRAGLGGQFQRAIELQPNNSAALQFVAFVHRRQAKWDATMTELKRAMEQDPRNASLVGNLAQTYCLLRQWKEAEATGRQAMTIDPHEATGIAMLLLSPLNQTADAQEHVTAWRPFRPRTCCYRTVAPMCMAMGLAPKHLFWTAISMPL